MVDRFRPGDGGRPKVRGFSPVGVGLQLSVLGVSFAITAPLSGRLVGRVGPRWPMLGLLRLGAIIDAWAAAGGPPGLRDRPARRDVGVGDGALRRRRAGRGAAAPCRSPGHRPAE
jgi:hypothetical protein